MASADGHIGLQLRFGGLAGHRQLVDHKLVDLQLFDARSADRQSPNHDRPDGHSAHSQGSERKRP